MAEKKKLSKAEVSQIEAQNRKVIREMISGGYMKKNPLPNEQDEDTNK